MDSKNVEAKNKPNTSEKSKPKTKLSSPSKGTKTNAPSSSRTSKEGDSNASQSRRSNRNDANDAKKSSPNDKYKQTPNSKSSRHNSNNSPADKNQQTQRQKKNFNPNYKSTWHKKDRNSRWNPAENRYRNLTWQRPCPSNDEFHNRKPIDNRSLERNPFKHSYNDNRENNSRNQRPLRPPQQNTTFFGNVQEGLVIQTQSFLETSLEGSDIQNTSREKEHPTKDPTEQAQIELTLEQSANKKQIPVEEPFEPIVESVGEGLQGPQGCDEAPEAGNSFFFEHKVFEAVNSDFGVHDSLSQSQEPAQDPLDALHYLQQRENQIKSEPLHISNDYETLDVKPELSDLDFNLSKCIDSDSLCPLISVIPISRLIKSELEDLNRVEIIAPTTPAKGKRTLKPNLVQRRKKLNSDGSLSENLVQRVANMDKVGIKNVINSSGTKYDAALKIQARKKLREEIRKQLKSMNFTPQENCGNSVIIPDEIVDSMNIPAVVLDEIRKAFGIVLLENKVLNAADELEPRAIEPPPRFIEVPPKSIEPPPKSIEPPPISIEPPPLFCPSPVAVTRPAVQSPDLMTKLKMMKDNDVKETRRQRGSKSIETVVVIDSSSSGSDESSSSSSDSDSSSTSSGSDCSNTSSYKRRRRKKRILEANVVGNFEKLILPNLTTAQRRRYKEKYSKTTKSSLLYIHSVCVRANRNNVVDRKETLRVKKNLTSADNAQALEFLMKAILGLFEKQKEIRQRSKVKGNSNPVREVVTSKSKDSTCNSVNDSPKQQHNEQTAKSAEQQRHESTKVDEAMTPSEGSGSVDRKSKDSISESACSAQGVSPSGGGRRLVASESNSGSETVNENDNSPSSRLWKSPGEKKFVTMELQSPMTGLGLMQPPPNAFTWDIESLKSQSAIGDEAVNSIREIDVKLMELHQRRMYIEEMVLKLQKDKMEVEFLTMKLQNEKFTILNSALANASTNATKRKTDVQSPSHDRSRKRHCDREETDKTHSRSTRSSQSKRSTEKPSSSSKNDKTSSRSSSDKRSGKSSSSKSSSRSDKSSSSSKTEKKSEVSSSKESSRVKSEETTKQKSEVKSEVKIKQKMTEEEVKTVEVPQVDYSNVPNGSLDGWKLPITQIIVVGEAIIAASEDGNIYKFNIRTRVLESKFSKHTEAITQIFSCSKENFIYTTSLDGFLKKTSIENFGLEIQSLNLQEPLQSIDIEWSTAFVGSRWGNIFTYDIKNNCLSESLLCSSKSSIIAIKATKEGPRKILIVSSKGNQISFRDAMTGLLLRTLDIPESLHIYSILLDDGCVFCGTQRNEIYQFNFTTGARMAIFHCGNGAVSMKLYKERYIFVGCYDGFVYVLDKQTGCQIGRFPGSGKMILAIEIAGDKIITSAKDNTTMQIADIPKYIVTKAKS